MEASSPKFAAAKPAHAVQTLVRPAASPNLAGVRAASVRLPLSFVLAGVFSLLTAVGLLLAEPDLLAMYHYTPHILAITHLFVLGFLCSIVMGAMYQLVPVTLETQLYSERLVAWQFTAHVVGFTGMVWSFWHFNMALVGAFGSLLTLGVGLFVFNLAATLAKVRHWHAIKLGIASALFWLSSTVVVRLFLAASKCWSISPFQPLAAMHAHAHLGGIGVFVMMIVTVSYKLVPMFTLGELQSERRAFWSITLLNAGLLGTFVSILIQSSFKPVFAAVTIAGLGLYGWEIVAILRARNRRMLDWGMKYFLTALTLLVPLSLLGLVLSWRRLPGTALEMQLESVYGLLAFAGLVGLAILGMLYKIVPFLVWFHSYSRQIGRAKVPTLAEMYSVPLQIVGYWSFLVGLTVLCVATAFSHPSGIRWGEGILASSLAVFAINMARILSHFVRPRIQAFTPKPATAAQHL